MKYFVFLITLFIAYTSISQKETDSLRIIFNHFRHQEENCCKLFSFNNYYRAPKIVEDSLYFQSYSYIQPVKQVYKNVLTISSLNYQENPTYLLYTKSMYYPMPERYFRRREIDVRKLNYKKQNGDTINVYPDTLTSGLIPIIHMYHWHPSYHNYPIHSITYEQAKAYCEWLQNQWNKRFLKEGYQVKIEIPSLYHYEMATKYNQPIYGNHIPENQTNLTFSTFIRESDDIIEYLYYRRQKYHPYTMEEIIDLDKKYNMESIIRFNNWYKNNQSYPIESLNGNVSEYCSTPVTKELINFYHIDTSAIDPTKSLSDYRLVLGSNAKMDVIDLKGNQVNAIFYKQLVHKDDKKAFYGFRPIFYVYPINE